MTTIPSRLDIPMNIIMGAFDATRGVEGMTLMEVKKVEQEWGKKIQVGAKVFVKESQRLPVRDAVADYLNNMIDDGDTTVIQEVTTGTSRDEDKELLDVVVGYENNKPQVIRIEIKPENSGGSGGGAAATKIQESGTALFTAIRYMKRDDLECHPKSADKCLTDEDYEKGWKFVRAPGVKLDEIMSLSQDWKNVFILQANTIHKKVGGEGWIFVRGDDKIEAAISDRFKNVVAKDPMANLAQEDKWNPADIWMVKESKIDTLESLLMMEETVDCLNNFLQLAFTNKNIQTKSKKKVPRKSLIGISLKKLGDSVRFEAKNKVNDEGLIKREQVGFNKSATVNRLKAFTAIDVYLNYGTANTQSFQARNFGGKNKGDWKLELKGEFAAMGKIQGQVMRDLLKRAKFKNIPDEPKFSDCKDNSSNLEKIVDEIYEKFNNLKTKPNDWKGTEDELKGKIREKDASYRYSKLSGLRLLEWINKLPVDKANSAMKEMYLYASSQSNKSSVYYKMF